jgi:GGDEF domain-containing protein
LATDDQRVVGWVWRAHVEHAINDGFHGLLIGELMCAQMVRVMPRSTLQEAIEVACVFEDRPPADPLLVAEGSSIRGIVRLRDLIRTATREGHIGSGGRNLLAGFPTRVQADLHMAEAIEAWRSGAEAACPLSSDVAFIDVRRFADYNAMVGYNVGDRLIRTIADLIESEILARTPGYFAAHLGDDRFIVCAPEGEIGPSLLRLIDRFEEFAGGLAGSPAPVRGPVSEKQQPRIALPRPAIRVLLLNGPLRQVRHARELYQMERDLRDECRAHEQEGTEIRSRLVMREMNRCDEHANGFASS